MLWLFGVVGLLLVVAIALVVLGRETARLASEVRPAVFDVSEAVAYIAERLPEDVQARLSYDDVRWVLLADVDLLESASNLPASEEGDRAEGTEDVVGPDDPFGQVVDEDHALARLLALADESGRELSDRDVVAVLDGRAAYLDAIGAIGPEVR